MQILRQFLPTNVDTNIFPSVFNRVFYPSVVRGNWMQRLCLCRSRTWQNTCISFYIYILYISIYIYISNILSLCGVLCRGIVIYDRNYAVRAKILILVTVAFRGTTEDHNRKKAEFVGQVNWHKCILYFRDLLDNEIYRRKKPNVSTNYAERWYFRPSKGDIKETIQCASCLYVLWKHEKGWLARNLSDIVNY